MRGNSYLMTLDEYLKSEGVTAAEFGARLDMSEASVSRIRRGEQNITRDVMLRIITASEGKITADGLLRKPLDNSDPQPSPAQAA